MTPTTSSRASAAAPRAHFVDLLRLLMSVQMIQGHVIDALLAPEAREGTWFAVWTWVRGLTAVGFMTAAGISFHLSSLARWDAYRADPGSRSRRVRRALLLIAIGYALHAPAELLSGDPSRALASLREAQMVDVLQCIGVTLLILEGITAWAPRASYVVMASLVFALGLVGLAPWAASIDCTANEGLRFACNYVARSGGSLFPLLPWSGFVFAGVLVGAVALPDGARTSGMRAAGRLAALGLLLGVASIVLDALVPRPADALTYSASPGFSLERLAAVVLVAAALSALGSGMTRLPPTLRTLAGETLVLYVSHLMALYVAGIGLARVVGPTLSLLEAASVAVVMIAFCSGLALAWARRRQRRSAAAR